MPDALPSTDAVAGQGASAPPALLTARVFGDVLVYLVHRDSLLHLSVMALILSLTEWLATLPAGVAVLGHPAARLLVAGWFFLVARKAALGSRRLPIPSDHLDTWDTLMQPLLQAVAATAICWAPLLVIAGATSGVGDFLMRYQARPLEYLADRGPAGYLLMALWLVQVPAATIAALCARGPGCVDPSLGLRLARRTGLGFVVLIGLLCALALIGHAVDIEASRLGTSLPIPLAGPVLAHLIQLWVPLAQARTLGDFIHRYRPWLLREAAPRG